MSSCYARARHSKIVVLFSQWLAMGEALKNLRTLMSRASLVVIMLVLPANHTKPARMKEKRAALGDDIPLVVSYKMNAENKLEIVFGKDLPKYRNLKTLISTIFSDDIASKYLEKVGTFAGDEDDDTQAYVQPSSAVESKWGLYVEDGLVSDVEELSFTLTHEFAHILALNESQMQQVSSGRSCTTRRLDEGCLKEDALLFRFYKRYWQAGKYDGLSSEKRYKKFPNDFVSDYAASDVVEDFAESFAAFVFDDKPTQADISFQKKKFFYDEESLILLRSKVRSLYGKLDSP
jgi:hypothetical protein